MSEKSKSIYACSNCGAQSLKWSGRCLECGSWGTLQSELIKEKRMIDNISPAEVIDLTQIENTSLQRIKTEISEFDRVLGGGIVPGSLVLLSGEPGVGKSTLVAQIINSIKTSKDIVYVSGEESAGQIKGRLERLNINPAKLKFIGETDLDRIISAVNKIKPSILIVDSIQTVFTSSSSGESGSLSQIRACASNFLVNAKENNIATILIGHITKDGSIAGPKSLEHIVDTVIYLESDNQDFRILRTSKNRFGSINELGIFEMTSAGYREIKNPSLIFLGDNDSKIAGTAISSIMEGTRPFLAEVQALVTKTVFGYPQRKAAGFDQGRLQILCSVLSKKTKIKLSIQDVIVNIVGGLKINDTSLDLAVCAAIISSMLNLPIDRKTIIIGEVGLGGEIRPTPKLEQKLREAEKLGFNKVITASSEIKTGKLFAEKIKNLDDLIKSIAGIM